MNCWGGGEDVAVADELAQPGFDLGVVLSEAPGREQPPLLAAGLVAGGGEGEWSGWSWSSADGQRGGGFAAFADPDALLDVTPAGCDEDGVKDQG
jgi:hypothetical protein